MKTKMIAILVAIAFAVPVLAVTAQATDNTSANITSSASLDAEHGKIRTNLTETNGHKEEMNEKHQKVNLFNFNRGRLKSLDNLLSHSSNLTADEAGAIIQKRLHLQSVNVTTEIDNGVNFYTVTGSATKIEGTYNLSKTFSIKIDAGSGVVMSINANTSINRLPNMTSNVGIGNSTNEDNQDIEESANITNV